MLASNGEPGTGGQNPLALVLAALVAAIVGGRLIVIGLRRRPSGADLVRLGTAGITAGEPIAGRGSLGGRQFPAASAGRASRDAVSGASLLAGVPPSGAGRGGAAATIIPPVLHEAGATGEAGPGAIDSHEGPHSMPRSADGRRRPPEASRRTTGAAGSLTFSDPLIEAISARRPADLGWREGQIDPADPMEPSALGDEAAVISGARVSHGPAWVRRLEPKIRAMPERLPGPSETDSGPLESRFADRSDRTA